MCFDYEDDDEDEDEMSAMNYVSEMPNPLILFEDDHLLVINKPPGINTHAVNIDGSAGIYDWLRHREPRWSTLATHQRLDKETSGVLLFGKSRDANQWLARRFELREVRKTYQLLTDRDPGKLPRRVQSQIYKAAGNDFRSVDNHEEGRDAETEFQLVEQRGDHWLIEAIPFTGRTHQIRLHARDAGFPILGDETYGGSPFQRLCLNAHILELVHPITREPIRFEAPVNFAADPNIQLRQSLWPDHQSDASVPLAESTAHDVQPLPAGRRQHVASPGATNAWRLIHGASNGHPGWYVDRLGDYLLSQSEQPATAAQKALLAQWQKELQLKGAYHKQLDRNVRRTSPTEASPTLVAGDIAPEKFPIVENGVRYWMSFIEGYSVGMFLDQKDNRHRLLTAHISRDFNVGLVSNRSHLGGRTVLNTFAYTCGFSVCAALAGATVTSLDLSRKYLDWGRDNFRLNGLDPEPHDFIYGDCFDWMKRLAKKGRTFDVVLIDPPTFSQSKQSGVFRADKDYGTLVELALNLLSANGLLLCSTNCATLRPEPFLETIRAAVEQSGRRIRSEFFATQSPDFPTSRAEPGYLKTVWLRIE